MSTANCPETPRQKMIGMMYLFYTALLALNVSAEVIKAFVYVNDSLEQTTESFYDKTSDLYNQLSSLKEMQPEKYAGVFNEAMEVKTKSDNLYKNVQRLKKEMVHYSDENATLDSIPKKDDMSPGKELMVGTGGPKKGDSLEMWVDNYREFMLSHEIVMNDTTQPLYQNLKKALATKDELKGETKKTWTEKLFQGMPLVGSITMLTKLQADVRNSEADLIERMIAGVDELDITISDIEAVVNSNSSYIVKGGDYEAEIFIAARDTTMKPKVYFTTQAPYWDSTKESGYELHKGLSYDTLPVKEGKGQYKLQNITNVGNRSFGGLIEWKSKRGKMYLPFKSDYMVGESGFAISPTGMNVFYRGLDNPIEISVAGYPKEKVNSNIIGGARFATSGGQRVVRITNNTTREATISVSVETDEGRKVLGRKKFRVLNVPTPLAKFNGTKSQGPIYKSDLRTGYVAASLGESFFPFDVDFTVESFYFAYKVRGQKKRIKVNGNTLNASAKEALNGLGRGTQINFESIKVKGPSGVVQTAPITLELK